MHHHVIGWVGLSAIVFSACAGESSFLLETPGTSATVTTSFGHTVRILELSMKGESAMGSPVPSSAYRLVLRIGIVGNPHGVLRAGSVLGWWRAAPLRRV